MKEDLWKELEGPGPNEKLLTEEQATTILLMALAGKPQSEEACNKVIQWAERTVLQHILLEMVLDKQMSAYYDEEAKEMKFKVPTENT